MRHLIEYISGAVNQPLDEKLGNVSVHPDVVRVFGIGADVKETAADEKEIEKLKQGAAYKEQLKKLAHVGLSRLTVRDAMPDKETEDMWESLGSDLHYTEYKAENTLDRLTSAANPRFIERVVEGSKFDFEMVYTAYQYTEGYEQQIEADVQNIFTALRLLEASALGKSGSRGYGKIAFHLAEPLWVMPKDYQEGGSNYEKSKKAPGNLLPLEEIKLDHYKFPADAV